MHSRLALNLLCGQSSLYRHHSVSTTGVQITGMCHHAWHCYPKVFIVYWSHLYRFVYLVTPSALQKERFPSSSGYTTIFWNLSFFSVHTAPVSSKSHCWENHKRAESPGIWHQALEHGSTAENLWPISLVLLMKLIAASSYPFASVLLMCLPTNAAECCCFLPDTA